MNETALLHNYLLVGAILFGIGLVGFLARRNMIVMFLAVEMMLQGISLSFAAWGRYHNHWGGQAFVVFILTVAACEAAVLMALVLMLFERSRKLDIAFWQALREDNQPPYVDPPLDEPPPEKPAFPHLTPAGIEPKRAAEEAFRSHV